MISLKNLTKNFEEQTIFKNISFSIDRNQKIALLGRNGSGKSTLLKILAGVVSQDEGKIEMAPNTQIAYFPQEISEEHRNKTGKEILAKLMNINQEEVLGKIGILCKKLYFPVKKISAKIQTLSGGEKSKLMLMSILNSSADVFLLDEPTNNLDLRGLIVLEKFITSSSMSFLIVSHDRKFLDRTIANVAEINDKTHGLEIYKNCSYSDYLKKSKTKELRQIKTYEGFLKEKKRLEKTIREEKQKAKKMQKGPKKKIDHDKYIPGFKKDRSKKFTSKASTIEKRVNRLEPTEPPEFHLPLDLEFTFSERSGDIVFQLENLEMVYGEFCFGPLDFSVNYGDRVVILGPNGGGKSTLLKILAGEQKPYKGLFKVGSRVKIGYLPQEIIFGETDILLDHFLYITELDESDARLTLARFGFFTDNMRIKLKNLSSGEKSRFVLATLIAKNINCLILDEPGNHLDSEAIDRLEYALKKFKGTAVMVSHDRWLIDQITPTDTYLMEKGKLSFLRDYQEYENNILLL